MRNSIIIVLCLLFVNMILHADGRFSSEIVDYGTYNIEKGSLVLVKKTIKINPHKNMFFGFRFLIKESDMQTVNLTFKTLFPVIKDGEKVFYISEYSKIVKTDQITPIGYTFNDQNEIVPGTWKFQVLSNKEIIAEQTFEVYPKRLEK